MRGDCNSRGKGRDRRKCSGEGRPLRWHRTSGGSVAPFCGGGGPGKADASGVTDGVLDGLKVEEVEEPTTQLVTWTVFVNGHKYETIIEVDDSDAYEDDGTVSCDWLVAVIGACVASVDHTVRQEG